MRLYSKAALAMTGAFIVFLTVMGLIKAYYVDPARRETLRTTSAGGLELAAVAVARSSDREATVAALEPLFTGTIRIEERVEADGRGWFERGGETFLYRHLDAGSSLVLGPLPSVDPAPEILAIMAISLALALAAGVAFFLITPLIRRLRTLERVTRRLAGGELHARAADSGRDAIGSLARNFNQMATEIEGLIENKRELLQAVSHEFRTPASRIRFELAMLAESDEEAERTRRISRIDDSLVEMDELVEELLTYVSFDGRRPQLPISRVAVAPVAREVVESLMSLRPEVAMTVESGEAIEIEANPRYFRRALSNVVANALQHAGSAVSVEIDERCGAVSVSIRDDGPGVPAKARDKIFEPFARLEGSRNRDAGGAGLGLAIVRRICDWHDASIEVADSATGAVFVMVWPQQQPPSPD